MSFARLDLLWLAFALPVLVVLGVHGYVRRRRRAIRALGDSALLRRLGAVEVERTVTGRAVILALAAASLGLAAAGPQWGFRAVESQARSRNIVFAVDVSKSMLARDVTPDRLERQRLLTRRLLRELRGDRFGLVAFAGRAYILSPLTVDHGALELYIDALDPGIVSYGGSSLSAALRQAIDLVQGQPGAAGSRAIVLMTDGEAHEESQAVLAEADRAAQAGIAVHTVGIGTREGDPVPNRDPGSGRVAGYMRDAAGDIVISRLNESLLRDVARRTGGRYVHIEEPGATDRLLAALRSLDQAVMQGDRQVQRKERFGWFVALALGLLVIDAALLDPTLRRRAREGEA